MKTTTRSKICLPMAAIMATAALAIPAAAQTQVHFSGAFQGEDTVTAPNLHESGTGGANFLDRFSLSMDVTINPNFTDTGTATWTAKNGDIIYTNLSGSAGPSDAPGFLKIVETHTITGGTGRFAGATGSFTVDRMHKLEPSSDDIHFTFGSFSGIITLAGAAH